jgi:hypothetical protein
MVRPPRTARCPPAPGAWPGLAGAERAPRPPRYGTRPPGLALSATTQPYFDGFTTGYE